MHPCWIQVFITIKFFQWYIIDILDWDTYIVVYSPVIPMMKRLVGLNAG